MRSTSPRTSGAASQSSCVISTAGALVRSSVALTLLPMPFLVQSVDYKCDVCGRVADLLPELEEKEAEAGNEQTAEAKSKYAAQIAQLHMHSLEAGAAPAKDNAGKTAGEAEAADSKPPAVQVDVASKPTADGPTNDMVPSVQEATASPVPPPQEETAPIGNDDAAPVEEEPVVLDEIVPPRVAAGVTREPDSVDVFLQYLTYAIVVALFALVYKKMLQVHGVLQ